MDKLYLEEIAEAVGGKILFGEPNVSAESVVIDSRRVTQNSLFIGLRGENVDGNDYFLSAYENGASIVIVDKAVDVLPSQNKGLIQVADGALALRELARYYKERFLCNTRFIGVTGSVGKTSVKDILAGMLSRQFKVFKTRGNYNNDLGLPLMLLSMDSNFDFAVLEMGMSDFGEIHLLAELVRPEIALITCIGTSHIEILKSRENILKAKMEITDFFNQESILFINGDDEYLKGVTGDFKIVRAGIASGDYRARNINCEPEGISFDVVLKEQDLGTLKVGLPGMHNVTNSILCFACAHELGISAKELEQLSFEYTGMRMQKIKYPKVTVINDAYNASPESAKAGLKALSLHRGRKIALVGSMLELGAYAKDSHREVGAAAKGQVDLLVAVGPHKGDYMEGFGSQDFYGYETFEDAVIALPNLIEEGDVIYLKASRGEQFERFLSILERL